MSLFPYLLAFLIFFTAAIASSKPYFPRSIYHQQALQKQDENKNPKPKIPYKTHYFPQTLDHFTFQPKSYKIFYQKYLVNDHYWLKQQKGPIFVYTGNEGDIEWFAANTGFLLDIAPKFNALIVFIEHRFYGESLPFGKGSYKTANTLGYLNSQQALADYAVLIRSLKHNLSSDASPVVVFGGSYGGMLAAWFRLKYPHIAIGALASSAPILQFDDITPWSSFYDAVSQDFKDTSLNCYKVIKGSWDELETFSAHKSGLAKLSTDFRACKFYGESLPFGKGSYKTANTLGYLNSQQALADYAVLIRSLKHNLSSDASPVVVFGGSYGGMLAAWFRLKYPHIAIGALASSAPILQFDDITPWSSFYDAVSQDFKDTSLNCYKVIKGSWDELETFSAHKSGLAKLSTDFRACKGLNSIYSARDWLWSAFVYTAMVNYPTEANFMKHLPANPVKEMCKIIDGFPTGVSKLSKTFAAASLYYNYSSTEKCFSIEHESDSHGLHGWDWQACTEMVMPMTCSNSSMFPPFDYDRKEFAKQCKKKYGVKPRPHWITTEFGGPKLESVLKRSGGNIIFSNGLQDPWSRGSVLKNISSTIIALVTKKGAHHLDFRFATKDDPSWLVEQRRKEVDIIQDWINEYMADYNQQ